MAEHTNTASGRCILYRPAVPDQLVVFPVVHCV